MSDVTKLKWAGTEHLVVRAQIAPFREQLNSGAVGIVAIYHRNCDGHNVEFYIELDQMKDEELGYFDLRPWHHDTPQRPKTWDRKSAPSVWGPPPTPDYLR